MNDNSFRKLAGICAILSGPLAILSIVVGLMTADFNFDVFSDMTI